MRPLRPRTPPAQQGRSAPRLPGRPHPTAPRQPRAQPGPSPQARGQPTRPRPAPEPRRLREPPSPRPHRPAGARGIPPAPPGPPGSYLPRAAPCGSGRSRRTTAGSWRSSAPPTHPPAPPAGVPGDRRRTAAAPRPTPAACSRSLPAPRCCRPRPSRTCCAHGPPGRPRTGPGRHRFPYIRPPTGSRPPHPERPRPSQSQPDPCDPPIRACARPPPWSRPRRRRRSTAPGRLGRCACRPRPGGR